MGRYKSDIQDSMLKQMEKVNRRSDRKSEDISLEAQLKRQAAYDKMSDEQKRAAVPYSDWYRELEKFMVDKRKVTTNRIFRSIGTKYSPDLHKFHETGASFPSIVPFIKEKSNYLGNL
jgi:hypothetical protein